MTKRFEGGGKVCFDVDNPKIQDVLPNKKKNPLKRKQQKVEEQDIQKAQCLQETKKL